MEHELKAFELLVTERPLHGGHSFCLTAISVNIAHQLDGPSEQCHIFNRECVLFSVIVTGQHLRDSLEYRVLVVEQVEYRFLLHTNLYKSFVNYHFSHVVSAVKLGSLDLYL